MCSDIDSSARIRYSAWALASLEFEKVSGVSGVTLSNFFLTLALHESSRTAVPTEKKLHKIFADLGYTPDFPQ